MTDAPQGPSPAVEQPAVDASPENLPGRLDAAGGARQVGERRGMFGVSGTGDRQSDFRGTADGVGDEVASRLHSRVLVRLDGSVVTLIL